MQNRDVQVSHRDERRWQQEAQGMLLRELGGLFET